MNISVTSPKTTFCIDALRAQFPLLEEKVHGKPLVYLDNAATTQKPQVVVDTLNDYYLHRNSNVHRGAHALADTATEGFEGARQTVADFLNARREEIIWTRGTTESLNLVAQCYGRNKLKAGDEIVISTWEHHANIVPWQQTCAATGAQLKVVPLGEDGSFDLNAYKRLLTGKTRIVAIGQVSNSLGSVAPMTDIITLAHAVDAVVVVDGAQAVAHSPVDVKAMNCDFYAFSGHKVFGPTGIGVLYGKQALLNAMPPWQTGGEMIETVTFEKSTWNQLPWKFEAGTPHIAGAIGLGAALAWLMQQDRAALAQHEQDVLSFASERAAAFSGLRAIGTAPGKVGIMSFLLEGAHPNDVGTLLDQQGIAVRTGHHCTMPLMQSLGIPGTVRASFSAYNTRAEVDALFAALEKVKTFL
jgi:cysteine desulfurase/selenocysteine lyase